MSLSLSFTPGKCFVFCRVSEKSHKNFLLFILTKDNIKKQAGAELGQAQVKLDDIVEVVVDVVVIAVVQVEV